MEKISSKKEIKLEQSRQLKGGAMKKRNLIFAIEDIDSDRSDIEFDGEASSHVENSWLDERGENVDLNEQLSLEESEDEF